MSLIGSDLFEASVLGLIAGLTEFIPVSSAGHLLLAQRFLGLDTQTFGGSFMLLVRLGALLALLCAYFTRLWRTVLDTADGRAARRFLLGLLVAFLPAVVLGALVRGVIASTLLNVWTVCFALIVGGGVLLWINQVKVEPGYRDVADFPLWMSFIVGLAQCAALIPGVSRAGATIVAAMLLGAERRAAADFSLWLAMPTMAGALAYEAYADRAALDFDNTIVLAVGFSAAFVAAWCVVKTLLDYVSRRGLQLFAWWRVTLGSLGLIVLALGY